MTSLTQPPTFEKLYEYEYSGRPYARLHALNGYKFTEFTHGGPALVDYISVPAGSLKDFFEGQPGYADEWEAAHV